MQLYCVNYKYMIILLHWIYHQFVFVIRFDDGLDLPSSPLIQWRINHSSSNVFKPCTCTFWSPNVCNE